MIFSSESGHARGGDSHGWTPFQNYLKVHHSYLDDLRDDFVVDDNLRYEFVTAQLFEIRGRIWCQHGLFVDVDKTLEVNTRNQVQTVKYSYHAGIEGRSDRPILRYDNAHRYAREGHEDEHHKHRFDASTWQEIEPPEWIGRQRWPHLSEVIEELRDWWITTRQHLDVAADAAEHLP